MSIQEVARQAGVSVATVSRAFNLPDKVSAETRERVASVARELGYRPNASARTLRTQRSRVLGVVLPTLLNPVFAECLDGIAHAAAELGYSIMPVTTDYQLGQEERAVDLLLSESVDGMILVVSNPATSIALQRLRKAGTPYVLAYNRHADHPCVSVDSELAVMQLVTRLAALGHREIAMVSGQLSASDRAQQRYRGFLQGMQSAGLSPRLLEVPFIDDAAAALADLIHSARRPTTLLCSNDLLAIRAIRAVRQAGLRVPEDVSVTGFDGIALGLDLTPMLSTVVQPNARIGETAVALIVQSLIDGSVPGADASQMLSHSWRAGESCGAAAGSTS
ncbi:LacI family DNA-binding transcriptional regulator [Pigmentiphaga aceris]|uniref:LacI family DNA-binding transcriptional regulator n=1 Tax=Pigmentiphaga aceris TaxID=1940612 RepID=A0A5C0B3J3_9BURK|nr:LacI family DNA-binding transcriptional regulator [Pigmentiphaga aceris]QEI08406.1 LacI family DNA-binding transcriptional regulator [Pigmentiphaga aceris]